jgi:peptidoglycan hydrolase-like protein with peptidoglycan-binding domain
VRAFRSAAHLTVGGIIGPRTWSALIVTVRRGSRGDALRAVQVQGSIRHEPTPPVAEGIFGPVTESYVRGVQQSSRCGSRPTTWWSTASSARRWHGFVAGIAELD